VKRSLSPSYAPAEAKAASCMYLLITWWQILKGQAGEELCRLHSPAIFFCYQPRDASSKEGLEDLWLYSGCMGDIPMTDEECEAGGFTSHA
jgi:hypothetical protein